MKSNVFQSNVSLVSSTDMSLNDSHQQKNQTQRRLRDHGGEQQNVNERRARASIQHLRELVSQVSLDTVGSNDETISPKVSSISPLDEVGSSSFIVDKIPDFESDTKIQQQKQQQLLQEQLLEKQLHRQHQQLQQRQYHLQRKVSTEISLNSVRNSIVDVPADDGVFRTSSTKRSSMDDDLSATSSGHGDGGFVQSQSPIDKNKIFLANLHRISRAHVDCVDSTTDVVDAVSYMTTHDVDTMITHSYPISRTFQPRVLLTEPDYVRDDENDDTNVSLPFLLFMKLVECSRFECTKEIGKVFDFRKHDCDGLYDDDDDDDETLYDYTADYYDNNESTVESMDHGGTTYCEENDVSLDQSYEVYETDAKKDRSSMYEPVVNHLFETSKVGRYLFLYDDDQINDTIKLGQSSISKVKRIANDAFVTIFSTWDQHTINQMLHKKNRTEDSYDYATVVSLDDSLTVVSDDTMFQSKKFRR